MNDFKAKTLLAFDIWELRMKGLPYNRTYQRLKRKCRRIARHCLTRDTKEQIEETWRNR